MEDVVLPSITHKVKQEVGEDEPEADYDALPLTDFLDVDMANNSDGTPTKVRKKRAKKSFICRICQKPFRDNYKLKRHERVHIRAGEMLPGNGSSTNNVIPIFQLIDLLTLFHPIRL